MAYLSTVPSEDRETVLPLNLFCSVPHLVFFFHLFFPYCLCLLRECMCICGWVGEMGCVLYEQVCVCVSVSEVNV